MSRPPFAKPAFARIVTANALIEGDVVYLGVDGAWTRDMALARVLTEATEAEIALAEADTRTGEVVGCYLAPVRQDAQGPQPTHFREEFRRRGPSNYAHGKQAEAASAA
ncbi:MAG: DUF2849 domain-containing protein [Rhodobacteraceae bacterium]|jgi:hypothetical protein|nr:DUF2849 domain-containing protein [Paracoccaceae bacterium]